MCLSVGVMLTACGDEKEPHTHEISSEWEYDDYYHYHEASCGSTNHRADVALHEGDNCFCGYIKSVEPGPTNTSGDDTFSSFTLAKNGTLKFNKIKGASKYVLTITPTGSATPLSVDVNMSKTEIKLDTLIEGGFPTGKTTVAFQAWEYDEVEIDGEKITEEVPMTDIKETFRVIKLNDTFTLQPLTYQDDFVKLDGFYTESVEGNTEYVYEFTLSNNEPTKFNVSKFISTADGVSIRVYKTADGRTNNASDEAYGEFDFSTVSVKHGKNYFYLRAVDANGTVKDYDLCVYGLYTVEITRYLLTTTDTDSFGVRTLSEQKIGEAFTVTERDIITYATLYHGIEDGLIARDDRYNLISRGDYMLSTAYSPKLSVYFYDEDTVISDCDEFSVYADDYGATVLGSYITLSVSSDFTGEELSIPYVIAGKSVSSVSVFYNTSVKKVYIAEGFTHYPLSMYSCSAVTDVYLPSTMETINAFAFKDVPTDATIHCAFSLAYADRFNWQWNRINGSINTYNTIYDDATSAPSSSSATGGLLYELIDGELAIIGSTDKFRGVIPDTAEFEGTTYSVTIIKSLGECSNVVVKIGKNIKSIEGEAFMSQVKGIELDGANTDFVLENGALYNADKTRLIVTCNSQEFIFLPSTLTVIDYYALYSNVENVNYNTTIFYDLGKETVSAMIYRNDGNIRYSYSNHGVKIPNAYDQYYNSRYYVADGVEYIIKDTDYYCIGECRCEDGNYDIEGFHALALRILKTGESLDISVADGVPVLGYFSSNYWKFTIPDNVKKLTIHTGLVDLSDDILDKTKIEEITFVGDCGERLAYEFDAEEYTSLRAYYVKDSTRFIAKDGVLYDATEFQIIKVPMALAGDIEILNGVTVVGHYMWTFENRKYITSVIFPSSVTAIGHNAFRSCSALTSVEFEGGEITSLGSGAFAACTSLTNFNLVMFNSKSFEVDYSSGLDIFEYCGSLKTINFNGTVEEFRALVNYEEEYNSWDDTWLADSYIIKIQCSDGEIEVEYT